MTQPGGIDPARSGWANPEGFVPRARDVGPAPVPDDICGDPHSDGWACELKPGHVPAERHWADTGEGKGLTWTREVYDVSIPTLQGRIASQERTEGLSTPLAIALAALEESNPGKWYAALLEIAGILK